MSCNQNMRIAADASRSAGITRAASLSAYHAAAYRVFDEALAGTDVETVAEFLDLTLRGKRPRRKKRTMGKYLFAGAVTGAALAFQRLGRQRQMRRIIRLRRQQQENRPQRQKTGGKPIDE